MINIRELSKPSSRHDYISELEGNRHDPQCACRLISKMLKNQIPLQVMWAYMVACELCDELTFPQRENGHLLGADLGHKARTKYLGKLGNLKDNLQEAIVQNKQFIRGMFDCIAEGKIDNSQGSVMSKRDVKMLKYVADLFKEQCNDGSFEQCLRSGGVLSYAEDWFDLVSTGDSPAKLAKLAKLYSMENITPIDCAWAFYVAHLLRELGKKLINSPEAALKPEALSSTAENQKAVERFYDFFRERVWKNRQEIADFYDNLPSSIKYQDLSTRRNPAADAWNAMFDIVNKVLFPAVEQV